MIETLLRSHPQSGKTSAHREYAQALEALFACGFACQVCADSCLAEVDHLTKLRRCIRTDLDCASICRTAAELLVRQTETPHEVVHAYIHACVLACRICAEECELHADMHEHCRLCAEACRRCQEACNRLLGATSSAGTVSDEDPEEVGAFAEDAR